ncbi:MAG: LysR substrate-binding domain-containing protein [Woeseiaceae bacterium]
MSTKQRLSLRGLRTFCVAAEYGSFRDAADELFITASAVSHQIKNLEQELGEQLFDRLTRSVKLTEAGSSLFEDVNPLIEKLDGLALKHRRTNVRNSLRISVQPFFASELFVPSLAEFTKLHPDIDIKVDTSDESGEKHPASVDASIRVFKRPPRGLHSDQLFPLRLVPAASAEMRRELKLKNGNLTGSFTRILHDSRPNAWRDWEKETGIELPENAALVRLDSMIAVARAAERGLGVALVPLQLSNSWFDSGALVRLASEELVTDESFYFVCSMEDREKQAVQKLRQWVLQTFNAAA